MRDNSGRFASAPGGGKKSTPSAVRKAAKAALIKGGTLSARASLKRSRAKLAGIDKADQTLQTSLSKRAQKGAVTRGKNRLSQAIKSSQAKLNVVPKLNTIKKKRSPILEARPLQKPASQRPGSMTSTLRGALRSLAQADAQRIREIESITGQKIKPIKERAATLAGERVRSAAKGGKVADTLRAGLRELAQSDARTMRGMAEIVRDATPKVSGGKGGKAMRGGRAALPAEKPTKLAASNSPKRELAVRVARADKVDNKLKAQLKQAKASGNLKKEYEIISRMQRVDRFNQTYNFADLKASRRALTPVNPTARGKVRPDANPNPAVLPITSKRRKPLKGIGAAIKGNLRGWTGLPVEIRSRKRSAAAQRYRSNELGKKVAASIGFNQAVSQRKTFAESSKRIVFKRGNMRQFNLFGGIQKVGGGRFKPVGERMASGRVYQPKYTRPLASSKTRKKEIERLINNNNGKAVAAFYL